MALGGEFLRVGLAALFGFSGLGDFSFRSLFDCGLALRNFTRVRLAFAQECPGGETQTAINVSITALAAAKASLFRLAIFWNR
jgi:hypothetical protein